MTRPSGRAFCCVHLLLFVERRVDGVHIALVHLRGGDAHGLAKYAEVKYASPICAIRCLMWFVLHEWL